MIIIVMYNHYQILTSIDLIKCMQMDKSFRKQVNTVSKNVENDRGRIYEIDGILETLKKIKEKYHGGKGDVDKLFIAFETDVNEVLQGYKDDSEKLKGKKEEIR